MQYLADANFRQNLNPRMFGQRPPYFPGRASDRSVPSVDEILGRGEAMPGRYLLERPPPSPPQNSAWSSSPRRTDRRDVDFAKDDASYMYAFQANPPGSPTDPSLGDYSKDPPNYANLFRENVAGGPSEEGSPTDPRRGGSRNGAPIDAIPRLCGPPMGPLLGRFGSTIARRRNGDPLYAIPGLCGTPMGPIPGLCGTPMGPIPGRCGSPMGPIPGRCGSLDYANIFGRNPPGGQAMFSDRRALLLNPFDPRPCIPNSIQSRRLGHWSSFEDGSSENGRGNRRFQNFEGNRSSQAFEGNRSSQDFQGNRRFQAFEGNASSHNFEGKRSSQYLNDFEDCRSDNDSGFIDGRPRCDPAGRRNFENFGNFGGSNEANDGRIQGIGGHSFQPLEPYHPEMGRKRRAEEFDNWQPEERVRVRRRGRGKRPCPEKAVFRIGGFRLDNASHCGGRRKLPQPEEMSHAVRFFKRYPVYRIRAKKSQMADSVKYHFMEEDGAQDDDDAFIRHTIAEEWVKVYAARNYRSWASWWSDFEDCGRAIAKELERFDGFTVKRNFEPPEGPIDSEAYLGMAVVALEENNITYLKNMRYLYRLIDFNVLRNLSASASGHLQDIIRSIPNHLWRYKMRSFVFLWSWYHKMANSQTPDGQTNHQAILQLWNNPVLHWLAKQAFDETVAISKIEYKGFKAAQLQGPRQGLLPLPQPQAHPEDQS